MSGAARDLDAVRAALSELVGPGGAPLVAPDEVANVLQVSSRLTNACVRVLGRIPFDVRLSVTADRELPLAPGDLLGLVAHEFA